MISAAILEGNGVDDKVVVDTPCVHMCCDNDLEPVAPELHSHPPADIMRLLRRDFVRPEALVSVIGNNPTLFIEPFLHHLKLIPCKVLIAVERGNEVLHFGLVLVGRILDDIVQRLQFLLGMIT